MESYFEISETGRRKDCDPGFLLEGTSKEVRRMATSFLMSDWQDGHKRSRVWLDGRAHRPTTGDIAEIQADIDTVLEAEAARNGQAYAPEPDAPAGPTFAERLRAMRG